MSKFAFVLAILTTLAAVSLGQAKVEADPNKEYAITPEAGAWTICAASFMGETSAKLAHNLVIELRTKYDLPAYVFNRGADQRREQDDEVARKRQQQQDYLTRIGADPNIILPVRRAHIEEQFAVLIGGFKDMDSARRELERIKKMGAPQSIPLDKVVSILQLRSASEKKETERQETTVNPFKSSFVAPNPTVSAANARDKADPFLKELNQGSKYSLLNCSKPWTLVVKDFQGATVVQARSSSSGFLEKLGWGSHAGEQLNAAAMQAEEVARALRELHFDAYVWHTRYSSLVTVGGYDSRTDPQLLQNQRSLANLHLGAVVQLYARPVAMQTPHF
jgi:hypothetical protein